MRWIKLAVVAMGLAGCGVGAEQAQEPTGASEQELTTPLKERWCNSYLTQQYCPKNVCYWNSGNPAGKKCTSELLTE